jgi:hypothetical protein
MCKDDWSQIRMREFASRECKRKQKKLIKNITSEHFYTSFNAMSVDA